MSILANILRDPKTNHLWLHMFTHHGDFFIYTPDGTLDLATCHQEYGEIVYEDYFNDGANADIIVAKDKNGNYAAFTYFLGYMGDGGIYVSITPRFSFRSIWGFANDIDFFIVGENLDKQWGLIRVNCYPFKSALSPHTPPHIPNEIVPFDYSNKDEVLAKYPLPLYPNNPIWRKGLVDLTIMSNNVVNGNQNNQTWGLSLATIQQSCRANRFLPRDKNECMNQIENKLSVFKDRIVQATSFTNNEFAWMRDSLRRRMLYQPECVMRVASLFNLTEPLIINDPDLMAAYLLSQYQQELLKRKG